MGCKRLHKCLVFQFIWFAQKFFEVWRLNMCKLKKFPIIPWALNKKDKGKLDFLNLSIRASYYILFFHIHHVIWGIEMDSLLMIVERSSFDTRSMCNNDCGCPYSRGTSSWCTYFHVGCSTTSVDWDPYYNALRVQLLRPSRVSSSDGLFEKSVLSVNKLHFLIFLKINLHGRPGQDWAELRAT